MRDGSQAKRRGRPPRSPVDVLRTKIWINYLTSPYTNLTGYKLERIIIPEQVRVHDAAIIRPRNFDKYQSGLQVPRDSVGKNSIVNRVNVFFPGSADLFRSPIWDVLKDKPVSPEIGWACIEKLGSIVECLIADPIKQIQEDPLPMKSITDEVINDIANCPHFSAFQALIVLIGISDHNHDVYLRNKLSQAYRRMVPRLIYWEQVPFFEEFFDLVDCITCTVDLDNGHRSHGKISWRDLPGVFL